MKTVGGYIENGGDHLDQENEDEKYNNGEYGRTGG